MAQPLICKGLTKTYDGRNVVSDVSLTLPPGQIVVLLGPSGAGKTTLLRLLAGMERPDHGNIQNGDTVLADASRNVPIEKRRIGLIFQDFALFPHLNVTRNITFGLRHLKPENRRDIAEEWLRKLSLQHRREAFPHELSGGEQQRVAIARALAPSPIAILLDEAFSGLDPALRDQTREAVLTVIRETQTPALLVSHDPAEALAHGDMIAVMSDGKLQQVATPETIYQAPANITVARALGPIQSVLTESLPDAWREMYPGAKTIHMRPEAIKLDPASSVALKVQAVRQHGGHLQAVLQLERETITALFPADVTPVSGQTVAVTLNPASVFAFPAPQS